MDATLTNLTGIRNFSSLTRNRSRQSIANLRRDADLIVNSPSTTEVDSANLQSQSQVGDARQTQFLTDSYTASGFNRQTRNQSLLMQPLQSEQHPARRGRRLKAAEPAQPKISSATELEKILGQVGQTNQSLQEEFKTLDRLLIGLQEQVDNFDADDQKDAFLDSTLVRIDSLIVNLERLLPRVGVRDQLVIELQDQFARYSHFSGQHTPSDQTTADLLSQAGDFQVEARRARDASVVQPAAIEGGVNSLAKTERLVNGEKVEIIPAIDASATTITLNHPPTGTGGFASSGVAYIGSERISYTDINSDNQLVGVTRGYGTHPSSHFASEAVVTEEYALTSSSGSSVNTAAQENRLAAIEEMRLLNREFGDYQVIDALITDISSYDPNQLPNQSKLLDNSVETRDKLIQRIELVDRLILELRDIPLTQPSATDPLKKEPVVTTALNLQHVLGDDSVLSYSDSLGARLSILDQQLNELDDITFPTEDDEALTFAGPTRHPYIDSSNRPQLGNPIGIRIAQDPHVSGAEFVQRRSGAHPFEIGSVQLGRGQGGLVIERRPLASESFQQFASNNTGLLTNNYT
ncbi:MAG: hypothetical protein QGI86_14360 [Candidatus Poribacteria bacterium]|nr:hypothetical protein [Candidatus Poribacteria bacterium]MDP6749801.1 hypothetical protein [Candidatus Poribacteria bacterium]MDP6998140.1 hypothetical protein [Candidatus Poribacteria bacterium]